jgi:hypothetical protein
VWFFGDLDLLWGLQLFDKANNLIAQSNESKFTSDCISKEVILHDDEKIIGVKARKH